MKIGITYTVFTEDEEYIDWFVSHNGVVNYIASKLGYNIINNVVGKHKLAKRPHYHICVNYEHKDDTIRKYKVLHQKIQHVLSTLAHIDDEKKLKVSTIYEDEIKKVKGKKITYDPHFVKYALKEYKGVEEIPIYNNLNTNTLTMTQLEEYRKIANDIWEQTYKAQQKQVEYKKEQEKKQEKMFQTIARDLLYDGYTKFEDYNMTGLHDLVKKTMIKILHFQKQQQTRIRLYGIKDLAITILFFHDFITADDIIRLINL